MVGSVPADARAIALLLHGGAEVGLDPVRPWSGTALRMVPFAWAIRRRVPGVAVARLRYRHRGWNGPAADPVADVTQAIATLGARHHDLPLVLVGHSMGARAAVQSAAATSVLGVVALAPWFPAADSVLPLAGRDLAVLHGSDDRRTSPVASAAFAEAAAAVARAVSYRTIAGGDHAMLRFAPRWHREAAASVAAIANGTMTGTVGP